MREPRNGFGICYRELQRELGEMWNLYQDEEKVIGEREAKNIIEDIKKITALANNIKEIAQAFIKIAESKPVLEAPPEVVVVHNTDLQDSDRRV